MLRSTLLLVGCFVAATNVYAQTIVPVEREPVYTKEDIFDRLTPLAPAKPVEQTATPSPTGETPSAPAHADIEIAPTTTLQLRQPTSPAPTPQPQSQPREIEITPTAAAKPAGNTSATLSPKLKALLKPMAQVDGQPAKIPAHAPGAMTQLSALELRTLIGHVAVGFDKELGALKNGSRWQNYLKLDELEAACQAEADEAAIEQLPAIGQRFASLTSDPQYSAVTKRNSFQTLNLALGEFLSLDDQRTARQQLLRSVEQLQQSLAPISTGTQWAGYFELPALRRLAASTTPVSGHDLVQLQLLLARFQQAAGDESFAAVAKLDGFAATQDSLRGILGVGQRPTQSDVVASTPPAQEPVATGEFAIDEMADSQLTQASATVERLPASVDGTQLVALGGKAFLRKQGDASWKQIGKAAVASGDAIAARDEFAQVVLGEDFALQLAAETNMTFDQRAVDKTLITQLTLTQGSVKAIANGRGAGGVLHLAVGDYQLTVSGDDFAVEFRVEKKDGRAVAIVHAGQASVENKATGDRAVVRAGREAVLLASGVALRGAPAKSDDWWTPPADRQRSARRNGGGFSE